MSDAARKVYNKLMREVPSRESFDRGLSLKKEVAPRVLIFDIETTPLLSYHWRLWKQNINHKKAMVRKEWNILTWAAKWLGEDIIYSDAMTSKEIAKEDDSRLVKQLWNLLDEADVIIAHNSKF